MLKPEKFTRRPHQIEAIQFTGGNQDDCVEFCPEIQTNNDSKGPYLLVPTNKGSRVCAAGSYIIKNTKGEYCVRNAQIFAEMYEYDYRNNYSGFGLQIMQAPYDMSHHEGYPSKIVLSMFYLQETVVIKLNGVNPFNAVICGIGISTVGIKYDVVVPAPKEQDVTIIYGLEEKFINKQIEGGDIIL